jgi:hypothetical protein
MSIHSAALRGLGRRGASAAVVVVVAAAIVWATNSN